MSPQPAGLARTERAPDPLTRFRRFAPSLRESLRFLLFGIVALSIDVGVFFFLASVGSPLAIAKSAGYLSALAFTLLFLLPRVFSEPNTLLRSIVVLAVYMLTGALNVLIFEISILTGFAIVIAYSVATIASASLNLFSVRVIIHLRRS